MPSDTFTLKGSYMIKPPPTSDQSGNFEIGAAILESMSIANKVAVTVSLNADGPESVNFSDLDEAHVIIIKADEKVVAHFTSADGTTQAIPVGPILILVTDTVPITAITLTRQTGVATVAKVVLAEMA